MATFKFYPYNDKPDSKVYLRLSLKRKKDFRLSTGLTLVSPSGWNKDTNYPKKNNFENKKLHNALSGLEKFLDEEITEVSQSQTKSIDDITSQWVKQRILEHFNETPKEEMEWLINYAKAFPDTLHTYKQNGVLKKYTDNTRSKYKNFAKQLEDFERSHKKRIKIQDVSVDLANKFTNYLFEEKKLAVNTIGHYIKRLKTILRSAASNGIQPHPSFMEIKGFEDETLVTFLTFEEIDDIIEKPMPSKRLEIAKDWLIIGCYTGQRISDFYRMKKGSIVKENNIYWIKIKQFKTGQRVRIPIHYKVEDILKKYDFGFPPNLSENEQSNRSMISTLMKEVCRIAGIKEMVKGRFKGVVKNYPKYKLIQNHSTRRSFCSNFYGLEGWTTPMIMQISGHKTEKNFLKYIDQEDDFYSNEAAKNFARMKEEDLKEKKKLRALKTGTNS